MKKKRLAFCLVAAAMLLSACSRGKKDLPDEKTLQPTEGPAFDLPTESPVPPTDAPTESKTTSTKNKKEKKLCSTENMRILHGKRQPSCCL